MKKPLTIAAIAIAAVMSIGTAASVAQSSLDFGLWRDSNLANRSEDQFGVDRPIAESSTQSITKAEALSDPTHLATLAKGLKAHIVTTQGPAVDDQISLWPNSEHPTYLIACNEEGKSDPGLVRIELATGAVSTIVTGTDDCDPTRRTPWGTIVFGEEAGSTGRLYELIDPIHTTGVTLDRTTGTFSGGVGARAPGDPHCARHDAFEGFGILPDGTTYIDGDDSALGPKNGGPGDSLLQVHPDDPVPRGRADHRPVTVAVRGGRDLRTPRRAQHELRPGP